MATNELLQIPGEWHIKYNYTAGEVASRFLLEVRNNKKIMGTRCDKCTKVYVPPRKFCEECFVTATEWVELDNVGEIESFTFGPRKLSAGLPEHFEQLRGQRDNPAFLLASISRPCSGTSPILTANQPYLRLDCQMHPTEPLPATPFSKP